MIELPPRYDEVLEHFGGGGMSEAVRCRDKNLDRDVVVKSLRSGMESRRLLDEINALSAIRSKYVVQLYDVVRSSAGEVLAVVEEYIPGPPLTEAAAPTTVDEALRLIYPIAAGIADIHGQGGVHRDVKPDNMKFDQEGCLKIFDFGLSRVENGSSQTVSFAFTEGYAAPELFLRRDGSVHFTTAVDTFAFGATVLALLTGGLPDAIRQIPPRLTDPAAALAASPIALPDELLNLLAACLAERPELRPPMSLMRDTISKYLLRDRHRGLLTYVGRENTLDKDNPQARLSSTDLGSVQIDYNGFDFRITSFTGDVFVNNMQVGAGLALPGSCVIVLGAPALERKRVSITFDVSHPEVML